MRDAPSWRGFFVIVLAIYGGLALFVLLLWGLFSLQDAVH